MAQMGPAMSTLHFRTNHPMGSIQLELNIFRMLHIRKAWPTSTGIKLCIRTKKLRSAGYTLVGSLSFGVDVFTGEGSFRPFHARHPILFLSQLLLPLFFRFLNFFIHKKFEIIIRLMKRKREHKKRNELELFPSYFFQILSVFKKI